MSRPYHGVRSGRAATTLTPYTTITVDGIGTAPYSPRELDHVEALKRLAPASLLNELAVIHLLKVELDATLHDHPDAAPVPEGTHQRQEALFG